MRKLLSKNCIVCGKEFFQPYSHSVKAFAKRKFCSIPCRNTAWIGPTHPNWKNGTTPHHGYRKIYKPEHPFSHQKYILEHRFVIENHLRISQPNHPAFVTISGEKYISPEWVVHHKDSNRLNNIISNLEVLTKSEHDRLGKPCKMTGRTIKCAFCRKTCYVRKGRIWGNYFCNNACYLKMRKRTKNYQQL